MEVASFKPPKNLMFDQHINKNYEKFLTSFKIYMKATGFDKKDDETKVAIFLNIAGEQALDVFQTFELSEEEKEQYETVIKRFEKYCKPLKNETYDRYKWFQRIQKEDEDMDHYITDVKLLAKACAFGNLEDSLTKDRIVSGIRDTNLQERLLRMSDLTLADCERLCRAAEASKQQIKVLQERNIEHYLTYYPMMGVSIIRNIISLTPKRQHIIIIGRRNMSHAQGLNVDTPIIPLLESKRFISECLQAVGTPKNHADEMGDLLVEADYRGHYSHGMNRLEMYINDVKSGTCDGKAVPKILKETAATAWVDGQNGLGAVIGNFCMDLAIKKAKEVGIGWVSAKGSNHFGIAGMYTLEAVKEGMLGMSFTNTSPFMAPTRGKQAMLGTNPLSLAAPGKEGDNFVLDMATTAVAVGKIEIAKRKGVPIPEGWAQDKDGHLTTDTANALARGSCLMPLGGSETNSGYKGYGLGFLVEIFCGILGGATYGPNVRKWGTTDRKADLGQCFVAINPNCFAPGFEGRLSDMMGMLRKSAPTDPSKSVLVAGEPEQQHMDAIDKAGGVRYLPNQMESCKRLSEELGVKPLKPLR